MTLSTLRLSLISALIMTNRWQSAWHKKGMRDYMNTCLIWTESITGCETSNQSSETYYQTKKSPNYGALKHHHPHLWKCELEKCDYTANPAAPPAPNKRPPTICYYGLVGATSNYYWRLAIFWKCHFKKSGYSIPMTIDKTFRPYSSGFSGSTAASRCCFSSTLFR